MAAHQACSPTMAALAAPAAGHREGTAIEDMVLLRHIGVQDFTTMLPLGLAVERGPPWGTAPGPATQPAQEALQPGAHSSLAQPTSGSWRPTRECPPGPAAVGGVRLWHLWVWGALPPPQTRLLETSDVRVTQYLPTANPRPLSPDGPVEHVSALRFRVRGNARPCTHSLSLSGTGKPSKMAGKGL